MIRIGIFFGGQSREREISFAGGRTVYDNLSKDLFEPVPVFIDSLGNFIQLNWGNIYKGTIRDFYPYPAQYQQSPNFFQYYVESLGNLSPEALEEVIAHAGKRIYPHEFASLFDFAFLALHGPYGEDGNIQGILEWNGIPYSGCGTLPSAIGINKAAQKKLMALAGFASPRQQMLRKTDWLNLANRDKIRNTLTEEIGLPMVIKASFQGSSIGLSVLREANKVNFADAVNRSFFVYELNRLDWLAYSDAEKVQFIRTLTDIREGIGLPVNIYEFDEQQLAYAPSPDALIYNPDELLKFLDSKKWNHQLLLESLDTEEEILVESFIKGKEFSCIVIQDLNGDPIALPPTEIIKKSQVFDYRAKYLPGISRKVTPIDVPTDQLQLIRKECERLFQVLQADVYARIDGFINEYGEVFLNDPNTTSGMLPSSFFFHQAAEIGLNPSQFLTYIIRTSLVARIKTGKKTATIKALLASLDASLSAMYEAGSKKPKVAVILGGYSTERHISVESGRNIYEKLASAGKFTPVPVFLTGNDNKHQLYRLPINVLLKDNADDIKEKVTHASHTHPLLDEIRNDCLPVTLRFAGEPLAKPVAVTYEQLGAEVEEVFIALHGRPGEDGSVQKNLDRLGLSYNGSGVGSSQITINKYETNELLAKNGIKVAGHMLLKKADWQVDAEKAYQQVEAGFRYPIIAKPADDGCSSAVKKIKTREELAAFARLMFRNDGLPDVENMAVLGLKPNEEFPIKQEILIESLIEKGDAKHFLEVTGGLLTHYKDDGSIGYEMFEPSETLASGEVLSLEEKFLAGEGQNITPGRFSANQDEQNRISTSVKSVLEKAAKVLGVEGYARIDAFVHVYDDGHVETTIIEINSLPGMTPATCIFHQCAINGYKPAQFIHAILDFGAQRLQKLKPENAG